jgi:glycosyltransferase involved in cell wall biosynthesis
MDISLVIPILNERENIEALHEELRACLAAQSFSYEIIYVDDGSSDGSTEMLTALAQRDAATRAVIFRRHYGQTAALAAGIAYACGDVIVTMDGDLQNDPRDIPRLLEEIKRGYDVVSGWRYQRQDTALSRRWPSVIANRVISFVTGVRLHDYGCTLKAYRGEIVKTVRLYGEMHRFIPALCHWQGGTVTEVKVNHRAREWGHSKYGIGRTVRVILDLLTVKYLISYSTRPLHIFGTLGLASGLLGGVICAWLAVEKLAFGASLANRPLLLLGILLIFSGVQLITLGLLAELLARVYHESQNKPVYSVRRVAE